MEHAAMTHPATVNRKYASVSGTYKTTQRKHYVPNTAESKNDSRNRTKRKDATNALESRSKTLSTTVFSL